jgi:DNA-binding beta-propeller fold protein YncE
MVLAPSGHTLYVTGSPAVTGNHSVPGYLTPVSTATGAVGRRIPVGDAPAALAFGPGGRVLYVACAPWRITHGDVLTFRPGTVVPVRAATRQVGRPIPVGSGPLALILAR